MPPLSGSYSDIANQHSPAFNRDDGESVFTEIQRKLSRYANTAPKRGARRGEAAERRKERAALRKELFTESVLTRLVNDGTVLEMRLRQHRSETFRLVQELIDIVSATGGMDNGPGSAVREVGRSTEQRFALASVVAYLQAWREIDREAIPAELLKRLVSCEYVINAMQYYAHEIPERERGRVHVQDGALTPGR